jgi:hypothetical protein
MDRGEWDVEEEGEGQDYLQVFDSKTTNSVFVHKEKS